MDSMARLNRTASRCPWKTKAKEIRILPFISTRLMHKYNAHAATDITGFGLLGHAQALARNQKAEV